MNGPTHVTVKVHRALHLKTKGKAGTNDAYVLIQVGEESYKTSVKERAVEPTWNEEYMFPLPFDLRSSDAVRVSVFHKSLLSLDELLGLIEIPLYKIRVRERARARRYALHDKSTLRSSFGKAGRIRKRVTDIADSPITEGGGVRTPTTPDHPPSPEPQRSEDKGTGEIELTISFSTETAENIHSNLLRPRSANGIDYEEAWLRRNSLPHSFMSSEDDLSGDEKRKSGNSFMSMLDVPKNFFNSALRRSAASSREDLCSVDSLGEVDDKEGTSMHGSHTGPSGTANGGSSMATNSIRPSDIQIVVGSRDSTPTTTPESSIISDSNCTVENASENSIAASESSVVTEKNHHQTDTSPPYENDDEDEINNHIPLKEEVKKERRKLPGFMLIDSLEKINKYQPTEEEINLFSGYDRNDLVSTVIRQHARLTLAETYIGDLEHYVNFLIK